METIYYDLEFGCYSHNKMIIKDLDKFIATVLTNGGTINFITLQRITDDK